MGHENKFSFSELDHDLKKRLEKYGSDNASNTRNEPFWRLKNDGVWSIEAPAELLALENTPTPNQLAQGNVSGSFIDEIYQELRRDPELIGDVANIGASGMLCFRRKRRLTDFWPTIPTKGWAASCIGLFFPLGTPMRCPPTKLGAKWRNY